MLAEPSNDGYPWTSFARAGPGGTARHEMNPSDRRAFERQIITRALTHHCALYGNAENGTSTFVWRSEDVQVGPEFASRDLAIDWMAERIGGGEGSADVES